MVRVLGHYLQRILTYYDSKKMINIKLSMIGNIGLEQVQIPRRSFAGKSFIKRGL